MTRRTRRCGSSILQAELEAGRVGAIMGAGRAGTGGAPSGGGRSNPPNGRAAARRPHRERPAPAVTAADWPALAPDVAAALERGPLADRPRRDVREHGGRTVRYGRRGSLRLTVTGPAAGTWTDHEAGASGGGLALVIHVGAADSARAAADWLRQHGVDPPESPHRPPNGATPPEVPRPTSIAALRAPARPRAAWTGARWPRWPSPRPPPASASGRPPERDQVQPVRWVPTSSSPRPDDPSCYPQRTGWGWRRSTEADPWARGRPNCWWW